MRHLGRWLLWTFALLAAAFILLQGWYAAHIWWWREHAPRETAFMAMRLAELHERRPDARLAYRWVAYDRISIELKRAVIAAEDAKFVEHEGFDWEGIQQALDKNTRKGRVIAGGSTITQQLAKNLFLSTQRSYWRKAEEALITLMLEAILDKRRILELYLNVIEWGDGIFGAEAASRRYFGTSSSALTREQAARLAAMAPNPRYYEKHLEARGLARKTAIILARMPAAELP
ncbi:MAG TPA: monofunctional biosynthetic peptidoglycan transglycosylase [Casimicrobiaceae bacterium]|jgi:monofunctional biosynthetic peptidoglycan transglycosylase